MAEITSENYVQITADGNYDIINLKPGRTYGIKLSGTFQTTVLGIQVYSPSKGGFVALDDTDATGIDGTGVTEFTVIVPGTIIRIVASGTGTAPAIDYDVFQKAQG